MNGMQPSAWCLWDIVDSHKDSDFYYTNSSGEKVYSEKDNAIDHDKNMWGVAMADHDTETIELTQKYYGYGQFTKYIVPGDTIIASSDKTLAAYNKDSGDIKIVALNDTDEDISYSFDLSDFTSVGTEVEEIRTSGSFDGGEQWAKIDGGAELSGKRLDTTLKAFSITTYVIKGEGAPSYLSVTGGTERMLTGNSAQFDYETDMNGNATWSVSDDSLAEIDQSGKLTAKSTGTVNVEVTLNGNKSVKTVEILSLPKINIDMSMVTGTDAANTNMNYDKAFDGKLDTAYDGRKGYSIVIDLGAKYNLQAVAFAPRVNFASRAVGAVFYGSNNGSDWRELYKIESAPAEGVMTTVEISGSYRYVKYQNDSETNANIAEIELYGSADESGEPDEFISVSANNGVKLINVPSNGMVLNGSRVRYEYEGKSYVTDPLTESTEIGASSGSEVADENDKYLFVHFTGKEKTAESEQIYFSVSGDAVNWQTLNDKEPVLTSTLGTKGLRDPHIVRSPEGDKFYLIATDLSINSGVGWTNAQYSGSKNIMIWESDDLVNWSEQRTYPIGEDIDAYNVGCVWAPESIWDPEKNAYMVFWASMVCDEETDDIQRNSKQKIYRSYTTDFKTFTKPELYIERDNHIIDTTILEQDGTYYRFSKDETTKNVGCEYSLSLSGPWYSTGLGIGGCEGPTAFKYAHENKWGLYVDSLNSIWSGYGLFETDNLMNSANNTSVSEQTDNAYNRSEISCEPIEGSQVGLRHGTIIPITDEEYERLIAAYPPEQEKENYYSFANDITASGGAVNSGDVLEWKITSAPQYFYIGNADFDSLKQIVLNAGHGKADAGTYKLYAYDNGGEPVTKEQLIGFCSDSSALGEPVAEVSDTSTNWGYNALTINSGGVSGSNPTYTINSSKPLTVPEGTGTKALILGFESASSSLSAYFDYIELSYDELPEYVRKWDTYKDSFSGENGEDGIVWYHYTNSDSSGASYALKDGIVTITSDDDKIGTNNGICYGVSALVKNAEPNTKYIISFKEKTDVTQITNESHGFYINTDTLVMDKASTSCTDFGSAEVRNNTNPLVNIHNTVGSDEDWETHYYEWTTGSGLNGREIYGMNIKFMMRNMTGVARIKDLVIEKYDASAPTVKSVTGEGVQQHSVIIDDISRTITVPVRPGVDTSELDLTVEASDGCTAQLTSGTWENGVITVTDGERVIEWKIETAVRANPVLDGYYADPNIVCYGDTYYIYPTTDGGENRNSTSFKCFSSKDLVNWKDEGVILDLAKDVPWSGGVYGWAPTSVEKDGKYYFYFSSNTKESDTKCLGVAVADSPTGTYTAMAEPMIVGSELGLGGQMIDPMAFIDDDGQAYIYWGNSRMYAARLNDDMVSIDESSIVNITPSNYTEGTFVIKRDGKYYFMWSKNDTGSPNYEVRYGVSDSPLGPVTGDTRILTKNYTNSAKIRGTGHHSVINIPGTDEWYICYHRFNIPLFGDETQQNAAAGNHREVCIDKMEFDENGNIKPVLATLEGITEPVYVPACIEISAENGIVSAEFNSGGESENASAYLAFYSEDGALISLINAGTEDGSAELSAVKMQNAAYAKAYLWNSDDQSQLTECVKVEL